VLFHHPLFREVIVMKKMLVVAAMLLLSGISVAGAEERFGVAVYPGAKYDEATSRSLKEGMNMEAACFRTNDSVAKVVDFYRKQKALTLLGDPTKEGALFRAKTVDVTVQNPWMNMKTGAMMSDTLITIVKNPAQE
jgi:hypothetical protein